MVKSIKDNTLWIGLAITVILLVLFYITYCNKNCNDYLHGMWEADDEYCKESGVSSIMVMVGPSQGGYTNLYKDSRRLYILMYDEEDIIFNRTVDVKISPSYTLTGEYQNRRMVIEDEDYEGIMPREMTLSVSIMDGHMVFYGTGEDKDTIYASLYKDHDATHKAKLMEKLTNDADDDSDSE